MSLSPAFILCSASSGSTLLANLLDRHSDVACGPELYVFNKNQIYCSYEKFKINLPRWLNRGLMCDGQISLPSFFINKDAYYCDNDKIIDFSNEATDLRSFFDLFFDHYLKIRSKKIWIEKSGSNSYYLKYILALYPNAKLIHITRDGRDSVTSIIQRKNSPYHAISHWLYNVAASLVWRNHPNYLEIRYEDLVNRPNEIINSVFEHLGFFDVDIDELLARKNLYWEKISKNNTHQSWVNDPNKRIGRGSIGRYKDYLSPEVQRLFWKTQLTPLGQLRLNSTLISTVEIMKSLGYVDELPQECSNELDFENYRDAFQSYFMKAKRYWHYEKKIWLPITQVKLY